MQIKPEGAGLGLRRELLDDCVSFSVAPDFFEVAPENWIGIGGQWGDSLKQIVSRTPLVCHGLSLSIGSTDPLDTQLISDIKCFLDEFNAAFYSEHLSYCSHQGHLYDLLPLPFTDEAIKHVSQRIREVQDRLERRIAIENVSYYSVPEQDMTEADFIKAVLAESQCDLLLDVNNVYVNSQNHQYDPLAFIEAMTQESIPYLHVAGHFRKDNGFIIDTHGANVIDPVWSLLTYTYQCIGNKPTLLERDFNIPEASQLMQEVEHIKSLQSQCSRIKNNNKN
ncbi:MAG: DUF692 domain-containing protein [Cellvibrionales bacterium]|nr:DUF692 domain-containing protein [Cellvibrionales bacterium]